MRTRTCTLALAALLVFGTAAAQPTPEEVQAAIDEGVAWLAAQQRPDGAWGGSDEAAVTALVIMKLEHHAVDRKWGLGLASPFDPANPYRVQIENGYGFLFQNYATTMPISMQPAGDPDSDGDGLGCYCATGWHDSYTAGITLMALCQAVELDRVVAVGPLTGWTYGQVARGMMDYLSFGQNDQNWECGGWGYLANFAGWSDNSNTGWVTLGLGFAETPWPAGCGFTLPQFVKDELDLWVSYIQNPVDGDTLDGGSGYSSPFDWVNLLKTGNLLQQAAMLGDDLSAPRVQAALDYLQRHWYDLNDDPGWLGWPGGSANYHATYTLMKGLTAFGLFEEFGEPPIRWQEEFETVLLEQGPPWSGCNWGDEILCTTWALLTLQKVAPPPTMPVDIKPASCPNPLNTDKQGVLPVAVAGMETFAVTDLDPASARLMGMAPLRWGWEDVTTPYEPFIGKEGAYDCTTEGADGYLDMTLKFDAQEIVAALEAELGRPLEDGEVHVLTLTVDPMGHAGTPFVGEDVVILRAKK